MTITGVFWGPGLQTDKGFVSISPQQAAILARFWKRPGITLSSEELLPGKTKVQLRVQIDGLRKALVPHGYRIENVPWKGWRLILPEQGLALRSEGRSLPALEAHLPDRRSWPEGL